MVTHGEITVRLLDEVVDDALINALDDRPGMGSSGIGSLRPKANWTQLLFVIEVDGVGVGICGIVNSPTVVQKEAMWMQGIADFELVCALLPDAENRGIATEGCRRAIDETCTQKPDWNIYATVAEGNSRAHSLAQRLGFVRFGIHRGRAKYKLHRNT